MGTPAEVELVAIGDNVVDCYLDLDTMFPGGNAVNVAVHAVRCGARAAYIGAVGTDTAGQLVLGSLRAESVDTTDTRVLAGPNAYATVRLVDGNRVFGGGSVGVSRFVPTARDLDRLDQADVVHTGDCSMLEEHLATIRRHARVLSYDFSVRPESYVAPLAPLVDIAVLSTDADGLDAWREQAGAVRRLGARTVVLTLGAKGAYVLTDLAETWAPAPAASIVDTLGAGDSFAARLLVGLTGGESLDEAAAAATAYATTTCAELGAFGHGAPIVLDDRAPDTTGKKHDPSTAEHPASVDAPKELH